MGDQSPTAADSPHSLWMAGKPRPLYLPEAKGFRDPVPVRTGRSKKRPSSG